MRATINFEADVSRVNNIMRSLVLEESNALQEALVSLERATSDRIVEGISEALEHIHGGARQLQQYQQMMVSFEKARFQTMIPQPADEDTVQADSTIAAAKQAVERLKGFEGFLDKVSSSNLEEGVVGDEES